jgi:hypothetical protein
MAAHRAGRRLVPTGIVVFAALAVGADEPAKKPAGAPEPPALPASLAGFEDSGTFHLYKSEERLVTIEFAWKKDGSFENKSALSLGGQTVRTSFTVTPDKNGRWEKIEVKGGSGDVTIVRKGGTVERTAKGETETYELKPDTLLFENFAPALFSQSVRAYDKAKGGNQKRPVVVIPGALLDVTLETKGEVERTAGGRDLKLRRYLYVVGGVEITVYAGADDDRVYLADVPAQQAAYVRAGFETLRQTEEKDPLISKPTHKVTVERGVGVPMRDGVKLSTDIYRPEGDGKFPVILIRTPYKKEVQELDGMYYARRGYAVAVQDVRGWFASPGEWEPFVHEPDDGYDAVEWLAAWPWSTGKVGMIGGSYLGLVQWCAASLNRRTWPRSSRTSPRRTCSTTSRTTTGCSSCGRPSGGPTSWPPTPPPTCPVTPWRRRSTGSTASSSARCR